MYSTTQCIEEASYLDTPSLSNLLPSQSRQNLSELLFIKLNSSKSVLFSHNRLVVYICVNLVTLSVTFCQTKEYNFLADSLADSNTFCIFFGRDKIFLGNYFGIHVSPYEDGEGDPDDPGEGD